MLSEKEKKSPFIVAFAIMSVYVITMSAGNVSAALASISAAFAELTLAAKAVRNVLRLAPSREDAASMFAPNYDHYFWSDKLKESAARIWR